MTLFIVCISITVIAGTVTAGPVTTPIPTANTGTTPSVSSSGGVGDTTSGGSASSETITPGGQLSIGNGFRAQISGSQSTLITFTPLDGYKVAQIVATEILKPGSGTGSKVFSNTIFNGDGSKRVTEITTDYNGNTVTTKSEYDSNGSLVKCTVWKTDDNGNPVTTEYYYDSEGNLVKTLEMETDPDGRSTLTETTTDSEGNKVVETTMKGNEGVSTTTIRTVTGKDGSSSVTETTKMIDGTTTTVEIKYDSKGNFVEAVETKTWPDGSKDITPVTPDHPGYQNYAEPYHNLGSGARTNSESVAGKSTANADLSEDGDSDLLTRAQADGRYVNVEGDSLSGDLDSDSNTLLNVGDAGTEFNPTGGLQLDDSLTVHNEDEVVKNSDGGEVVRETYTYSDGSRGVAETTTYPSGKTKEVYTRYDLKGNVKEIFVVEKSTDSEGNPVVRTTDTQIESDGSKYTTETESTTDLEGNKKEKKVVYYSESRFVTETTTSPYGSVESTEKEYKSGILEKTTVTTTYSDGREDVSVTTYDKDGNEVDSVDREYDENGLLTYSSGDSDDKSSSGVSQADRWSQ